MFCIDQTLTLCRTSTHYLEASSLVLIFDKLHSGQVLGKPLIFVDRGLESRASISVLEIKIFAQVSQWMTQKFCMSILIIYGPPQHGTNWKRSRKIPALLGNNIYNADWAQPTPKPLNWENAAIYSILTNQYVLFNHQCKNKIKQIANSSSHLLKSLTDSLFTGAMAEVVTAGEMQKNK